MATNNCMKCRFYSVCIEDDFQDCKRENEREHRMSFETAERELVLLERLERIMNETREEVR